MCCNNHDDVFHLGFVLKISVFSESFLKQSRSSMIEFFCENNELLTKKELHH